MNKKLSFSILFILCFWTLVSQAQERAVTSTGEEVILFNDGTWKYMDAEVSVANEIKVNPKKFGKPSDSSFLLKSQYTKNGFWLDPKKWLFKKATDNLEAEYELQLKEGGLYGMVISEKIEIPLEPLKNIAFENAQSVAPDMKIVEEEYRTVNGLKVLFMRMDGTTQGIKFTYYGYYFSNEDGTVQFITYTATNLIDEYQKAAEDLLNGIVLVE